MKNYLGQTLGLATLVTAFLIGLSILPEGILLAGYSFRKMDIFSDIRALSPALADSTIAGFDAGAVDTVSINANAGAFQLDSAGLVPPVPDTLFGQIIEDYTLNQSGLSSFFAAVDSISVSKRTVRVAFFGDSFVEGDILLGDLRDTLQSVWGGAGVGFVPVTSEVARFKRTLVHRYDKWSTFSIVKNHASNQPFGINGFVYRPLPGAFVQYEGADYFRHTGHWNQIKLFYSTQTNAPFLWQQTNMQTRADTLLAAPENNLGVWTHTAAGMRAFSLQFEQADSTLCLYGASLESGPGIYIDNFSVRGNTGGRLKLIAPGLARQFDKIQQYDLIVVQLGLNAVTPSLNNIRWYRAELDQTFKHLESCFPGKTILVISVADRAGKVDGELASLPSVAAITAMQRQLAREYGFLFYDLYHGMGGPGSMIKFAEQKPALANKDYTHLTHEGGKVIGHLFARLFFEAQTGYRHQQESAPSK